MNVVCVWFYTFSEEFVYGFSTESANKLSSLFIICSLGQEKVSFGRIQNGQLLVPVPVSKFVFFHNPCKERSDTIGRV